MASQVADDLIRLLTPSVSRIAVAGSLRRGSALVGDIEILFIPRTKTIKEGLFDTDTREVDLADEFINSLFTSGLIGKRMSIAGFTAAWGPKNKLAIHLPSGIPVDFFATTDENWHVSLVIRTGSKETNLRLTTGAQRLNRTLHAYGNGVTCRKTGERLIATTEREVFELCGIPYLNPEKR